MTKIKFQDLNEVAKFINDSFLFLLEKGDEEYPCVTVVGKYGEIGKLLAILSDTGTFGYPLKYIILEAPEVSEYEDEYILTLSNLDKMGELWCQRFKTEQKDEYLIADADTIIVFNNCSPDCISHCYGNHIYKASLEDYELDEDRIIDDDGNVWIYNFETTDEGIKAFTIYKKEDEDGKFSSELYCYASNSHDFVNGKAQEWGIKI